MKKKMRQVVDGGHGVKISPRRTTTTIHGINRPGSKVLGGNFHQLKVDRRRRRSQVVAEAARYVEGAVYVCSTQAIGGH